MIMYYQSNKYMYAVLLFRENVIFVSSERYEKLTPKATIWLCPKKNKHKTKTKPKKK